MRCITQFLLTHGTPPTKLPCMDDSPTQLLADIEVFLATARMAETTFGRLSVNDGKFVGRLRAGANPSMRTAAKVREFIRTEEEQS
jgi:hypothetical protein